MPKQKKAEMSAEKRAKLEKDSYAVRRKEGRPNHGQTSFWLIGIAISSWLMLIGALAMGEWRSNWIGMLGYTTKRSWGMFTVSGFSVKTHFEAMNDTCKYFSKLAPYGVCMSPICLWYRLKCQTYMDLCMTSYISGFFFGICLMLHSLCIIWTLRMTPRFLRWAAIWWIAQLMLHLSVVVFWWMMTSESFTTLDMQSMYPEPNFSFCFWAEMLVIIALGVCASLGLTLMKMWPESSSGSSDSDSDDSSSGSGSGSDDDRKKKKKGQQDQWGQQQWGAQQGYGPGYDQGYVAQGYDPNMGPPQGYDPSMGPPPQGYPQPGYDVNGPPQGYQPGFDPSVGPPPQGMQPPPQGYPPQGFDPSVGPPPQGQPGYAPGGPPPH